MGGHTLGIPTVDNNIRLYIVGKSRFTCRVGGEALWSAETIYVHSQGSQDPSRDEHAS